MQVLGVQGGMAHLSLSKDELVIVNNALLHAPEFLDKEEFGTLMGCMPEEARNLFKEVNGLIDSLPPEK